MKNELPDGYIRVYLMNPDLLPEDSRLRRTLYWCERCRREHYPMGELGIGIKIASINGALRGKATSLVSDIGPENCNFRFLRPTPP